MNTQENQTGVKIYRTLQDIKNNEAQMRKFEFLGAAQVYAEMIWLGTPCALVQVIQFDGSTYCEYEN